MSSTAYRNAHGVELKPGNWFLGADEYGQKQGIIDRVVKTGQIVEINGGPSVVFKSAPGEYAVQTILADNVFQTLGPMTIEGDGTVKQNPAKHTATWWSDQVRKVANLAYGDAKHNQSAYALVGDLIEISKNDYSRASNKSRLKLAALQDYLNATRYGKNPLTRVKVKSPAQRGGGEPSPRLTKRRKTTQKAPPGFYANPTPRLERADQPSQREHFNAKTGKMTKRASPRLKERRALTHYADTPGVWANPAPKHYGGKTAAMWVLIEIQKPGDRHFKRHATFEHVAEAKMYARALHNAHPTWTIRVSDES